MNKVTIYLILVVGFVMVGLFMSNKPAYAYCAPGSWCYTPGHGSPNPDYPMCVPSPAYSFQFRDNPGGNGFFRGNSIPNANGPAGSTPCSVLDNFGPALSNVNNASEFINTVKGFLGSTGNYYQYSDTVGASFIIDFMLGRTPDGSIINGVNYAEDPVNLARWENLVNTYASGAAGSAFWVDWNSMAHLDCGADGKTTNSAYSPDIGDDVIYRQDCATVFGKDLPEIVFYWNNGKSWFAIGKPCGNIEDNSSVPAPPITNNLPYGSLSLSCANGIRSATIVSFGDLDGPTQAQISTSSWGPAPSPPATSFPTTITPLPLDAYTAQIVTLYVMDVGPGGSGTFVPVASVTTAPCAKLTCSGNQITPEGVGAGDPLDPYEKFDAAVSVTAVPSAPPGTTMTLAIVDSKGKTIYTATQPTTIGSGGTISSATFPGIAATGAAGEYEIDWHLNAPAGISSPFCNDSFEVAYAPYLKVYGGDVSVGASPYGETTNCIGPDPVRDIPNINAGIYAWNRYTTDNSGAGTEVAARTLGLIAGFATGQGSSTPPPTGLSFANNGLSSTQLNPGSGLFGGFLYPAVSSDLGPITADCGLTSDITQAPLKTNQVLSSLVFNPLNFTGQQVVYVNDADVYIDTNIQYATAGGWASTTDIPSFKLVVIGGNIYIGNNVSRLDGLYISEPQEPGTDYNGGIIFDCARKVGSSFQRLDFQVDNTFYGDCNNQLVVNGAFVGREVKLARTYGSIGQTIGTPDTLLGTTNAAEVFNYTPELWLPRGTSAPNGGYTSITGLPPVL